WLIGCGLVPILFLFMLCGTLTAYLTLARHGLSLETDNFEIHMGLLTHFGGPNGPMSLDPAVSDSIMLWPETYTRKSCEGHGPLKFASIGIEYMGCHP